MAKSKVEHQRDIEERLRSLLYVQPADDNALVASEAFWSRCTLLNPNWGEESPNRIFVDGYLGGCKWNSWKVSKDALEPGIRVFQGYAFSKGSWAEHCWCALGDRIIETTAGFEIYYGEGLTPKEVAFLNEACQDHDPLPHAEGYYWTTARGERGLFRLDGDNPPNICRERDPESREVKEGLGH